MRRIIILYYLLILILVIFVGAVVTYTLGHIPGNFNVQVNSFIEAIYFTVVTISTVGYGDIVPISSIARIFVIILITVGIGIFAFVLTSVSSDIMNKRLESLTGRISRTERRLLRNHIVLIGYGPTNATLCQTLKAKGERFVIVSSDKVIIDQLADEGYKAFFTDVTSESEMESLNLDKAKKVIIDMRNDSLTVYVSLLVKNISKRENMVVVAEKPIVEKQLKSVGMENIINPGEIAASYIMKKMSSD